MLHINLYLKVVQDSFYYILLHLFLLNISLPFTYCHIYLPHVVRTDFCQYKVGNSLVLLNQFEL